MKRALAIWLGVACLATSYLTSVFLDHDPWVRLSRALLATVLGLAVGALCGWFVQRVVVSELARQQDGSAEGEA